MQLSEVQSDYIQKSKIFLYPQLGIRRGGSVTPIETYTSWEGSYTFDDCVLIVLYHLRDDQDFKTFESRHLLKNKYFKDFSELANGDGVYIFDLKSMEEDYRKVLRGKYSQLSEGFKKKIINFYANQRTHQHYVLSYLEPMDFVYEYSELLNIPVKILKKVGELCNRPQFKKEQLRAKKKFLTFESV